MNTLFSTHLSVRKIISLLSLAVIIGSIAGFVASIHYILANRYIEYEMFRLAAVVIQKNMNYSVMSAISGVAALYILWLLLVEKIKCNKTKTKNFFKLFIVTCFILPITDWLLREFTDIPLLYGLKLIFEMLKNLLIGKLTIHKLLLRARVMLLSYLIFVFVGAIAILLFYRLLKKLSIERVSKHIQRRSIVNTSIICGGLLLILNLGVTIEHKINAAEGPNVIFIVIDALRPDHLGSYGYNRLTSPNIDRLSNDGIIFKSAISQGNRTTISMPSMFTATYISDQGYHMLQKIESRFSPLSNRFTTIAEILKNAGYITQAVSCQPWVSPESGFGQGFDRYDIVSSLDDNLSDQKTVQKAIQLIDKNSARKFFLFLNLMGPHTPYNPPPPYDTLYSPKYTRDSKLIEKLKEFYLQRNHMKYYKLLMSRNRDNMTAEDLHQLIALYDGKISFTDIQIGSLIQKLKELKIYENTLIVLTADHGEAFLEHDKLLHGRNIYNEEVHVPLIITYPDKLPKGKRVDDTMELVDILPTITNIIGIPAPGLSIRGVSLYPFGDNSLYSNPFAYSEGSGSVKYISNKWSLICSIRNWNCELYDLDNDPGETKNLIKSNSRTASELKKILFKLINRRMDPSPREVKTLRIPEKTKKELKSLGYLQ